MNLREAVSLLPPQFIYKAIDEMTIKELHAALKDIETPEFSKQRQELQPRLKALLSAKLEERSEERHRLMRSLMIATLILTAASLVATILLGLLK